MKYPKIFSLVATLVTLFVIGVPLVPAQGFAHRAAPMKSSRVVSGYESSPVPYLRDARAVSAIERTSLSGPPGLSDQCGNHPSGGYPVSRA